MRPVYSGSMPNIAVKCMPEYVSRCGSLEENKFYYCTSGIICLPWFLRPGMAERLATLHRNRISNRTRCEAPMPANAFSIFVGGRRALQLKNDSGAYATACFIFLIYNGLFWNVGTWRLTCKKRRIGKRSQTKRHGNKRSRPNRKKCPVNGRNATGNLRRYGIVNDTLPAFETNHALLRGSRRRVIFKWLREPPSKSIVGAWCESIGYRFFF